MALSTDNAQQGAPYATAVAVSASDTVIKSKPGRIGAVVVTATGSTPLQIFDSPTSGSGTIIAVIPATPVSTYVVNMPAAAGITVKGNAGNPAVTIGYW